MKVSNMKKLILGALNIDRRYQVDHFVSQKETICARSYTQFCGGKGYNQAVAFARAGSQVYFAGVLGSDGEMLKQGLALEGIDTGLLKESVLPSGHAVIQVSPSGENCIIIVPGANAEVDEVYIDNILNHFSAGDLLVLQNEIPKVEYAIIKAYEKGMVIAFNPSPMTEIVKLYPLKYVSYLFINEVEGQALVEYSEPRMILSSLHEQFPNMAVLLTLGESGAWFQTTGGQSSFCPAVSTVAVDTTAAGDTFAGYFFTEYFHSGNTNRALKVATAAATIAISKEGAAQSIPTKREVIEKVKP